MPSDWWGGGGRSRRPRRPGPPGRPPSRGTARQRPSSSACRVWWNRSTLPVVVGPRTAVSRWVVPFSRQIRSNSTSAGRGLPNRPVNCSGVAGQHLVRHAVAAQRGGERRAHRPAGRPLDQGGDHAVAGVVVQAADQLELAAVGQLDVAHHVQLPQLHRPLPLPAATVRGAAARARLDQLAADQQPRDRRPRRHLGQPGSGEFVAQPDRSPPGMLATQLTDLGLHRRRGLVRAAAGTVRTVLKAWQASRFVASQPAADRLAADAVAPGDLGDGHPAEHLLHGVVALLDHALLPQHWWPPCLRRDRRSTSRPGWGVKHQPRPRKPSAETPTSSISRDRTPCW
jgi:hypothetical protein